MASPSARGELVRLERKGPVAWIELSAPPVNVLSAAVLEALAQRLDEVERDSEARVVVLASASEKAFAAGANIKEMAGLDPVAAERHATRGQGVADRIERLCVPVIAAVHGVCLGGGCEIALACDVIVASDDATFGQPEIQLGVMPGWGGTQRLPRRVGAAQARWWILSGRPASAQEAMEQGLVLRVVPRAELRSAAEAMALELAAKPAEALQAAKLALNGAIDRGLESGLQMEKTLWSNLFGTADQREGMQAFLEKRPARFSPRRDVVKGASNSAIGRARTGGSAPSPSP
ncbi:MAG: enoyl-CoA hydratase-related protein [Thermoplasmata archaeon]|nr:enoyl-CoA hydratase-related protein [Thermoplasmata archaeon]